MADKKTSWILELIEKVSGPSSRVTAAMNTNTRSANEAAQALNNVQNSSNGLRNSLLAIGAGISFGVLVQQSAAFETSMLKSQTILKTTQAEFAGVNDQVRQLSENIPLAKTELADGLYEVLSAGIPKENAIQFLKDSSEAAVGGISKLPTVINATTTMLKNYGIAFTDAGKIQDKFQKTVELGQIPSLEDLAAALPQVTAFTSALGVSVDETLGVFGSLTGPMGSSSEVATQLSSVLRGMIKPTSQAQEMAQKLGITFNSMSVKNAGGLQNFLESVNTSITDFKTKNKSSMTREEIIGQLFGDSEAIKGFMGMTGQLSNAWFTATQEMANSSGAAHSAFETMSQGAQAQAQLMRNSVGNAFDQLYVTLAPLVIQLFRGVSAIFSMAAGFMQAHPWLLNTVLIFGGFITAMYLWQTAALAVVAVKNVLIGRMMVLKATTVGGWVWGLVAAFWGWASSLSAASVAQGLATAATWLFNAALWANPIVWIIAAIIAVIAAIVLMIVYWDEVKAWFADFGKWMWDHHPFKWLIDLIERVFPGFKAKLKEIFQPIIDWFSKVWDYISKAWEALKLIWGWGTDTKATVEVAQTTTTEAGSSMDALSEEQKLKDMLAGANGGGGATGAGAGANKLNAEGGANVKALTMNLTIHFNNHMSNLKEDVEKMKESIFTALTDVSRDALIVASK